MKKFICFLVAVVLCFSAVGCKSSGGGSNPDSTGGSDTGSAHVHSYALVKAVKATCTENGNSAYYACDCGKIFLKKGVDYVETDLRAIRRKARAAYINTTNRFTLTPWLQK